jgi:hypothetical protein
MLSSQMNCSGGKVTGGEELLRRLIGDRGGAEERECVGGE